jgi:hypothetical protein
MDLTDTNRLSAAAVLVGLAALSLPFSAAAADANDYADPATWLCLPGRDDACSVDLSATVVHADGRTEVERHESNADAPIDCFYVYPTVSSDPTPNADMNAGPEELAVIRAQFARFGSQCRTFAPLYRQVTLTALRAAVAGQPMEADRMLAYQDVVDAWNHYLTHHNAGRGVVLVGHSQGAGVLTQVIRNEIEGKPVQSLLVSALLIGSNLTVPKNADVGGSLATVPLCREPSQTGCLVTFVSFRQELPPPDHSRFGRAMDDGMEAACTNPATLAGGRAPLNAYLASGNTGIAEGSEATAPSWLTSGEAIDTPFVRVPGLLEGKCVRDGAFHYLSVRTASDENGPRTHRIGGDVVGANGQVAADWGLHLIDMHLAMGDLVDLVGQQTRAWLSR